MLLSRADATTAPVAVMVEDVNDNPPQFVSTSLTASVAEEAEFGTIVTTIMVGKTIRSPSKAANF